MNLPTLAPEQAAKLQKSIKAQLEKFELKNIAKWELIKKLPVKK